MLKPLEEKLAEVFKNAPKLPENTKKSLVNSWYPWIALIFGILQLLAVWSLWNAGHQANDLINYANELSRAFGGGNVAPELGLFYWVALAFLAADAVILLLAYPGLKAKTKAGWDWLFFGSLVYLAYGVASVFVDKHFGGGAGDLVQAVVSSAISMWLLFQVRDMYKGAHANTSKPADK